VHGQPFVLSLPTGGAETISRCEAGDYVPVVEAKDGYAGLRMADGKVGWVPASALELLDEPAIPVARPDDSKGRTIVIRAMSYLGVPYVWGGTTASGLDCSGFVQRVFGEGGIDLPRVACDQAQVGTPIGLGALEPGDRIYFQAGHEIDHTGIYIGNGRFIHASGSGGAVRVDDLMGARWQRIYAGARRSNL
jgi:cell wall-associated NlpC family hydrolase